MNRAVFRFAFYASLLVAVGAFGVWLAQSKHGSQAEAACPGGGDASYWYDPMYPDRHFDKPGKSPFMDMQLQPKCAEAAVSGAGAASSEGAPLPVETQLELGRNVYSALLDLPPDGGEATVELELSGFTPSPYRLDVWSQLLAIPDHLRVEVTSSRGLTDPVGFTVSGRSAVVDTELTGPLTLSVANS